MANPDTIHEKALRGPTRREGMDNSVMSDGSAILYEALGVRYTEESHCVQKINDLLAIRDERMKAIGGSAPAPSESAKIEAAVRFATSTAWAPAALIEYFGPIVGAAIKRGVDAVDTDIRTAGPGSPHLPLASEIAKDAMELAQKLYMNKPPEIDVDRELVPQYAALIQFSFEAWSVQSACNCGAISALKNLEYQISTDGGDEAIEAAMAQVDDVIKASRQSASGYANKSGYPALDRPAPTDEKGDGSEAHPFTATFVGKGFKRHDSNLFIGICERDEGFEILVTPETGKQRLYAISPVGDCLEVGRKPTDEKALGEAARAIAKKWLAYPTDSDYIEEESLANCLVEFALSHESPKEQS